MSKYIESPEKFLEYFEDYKKHAMSNPMIKRDYVGKDGKEVDTQLQVPYTMEGFQLYLAEKKIIQDLCDYIQNRDGAYSEYVGAVRQVQNACFVQNYNGASVGLFNAQLTAKKLSLIEKIESNNTVTITQITGMEVK